MRTGTDNTDQMNLHRAVNLRRITWPALLAGIIVSLLVAAGTTITYLLAGGTNPSRLLNFVASGLVGAEAFGGGGNPARHMALLGAVLHGIVSFAWAFVLFAFSMKFPRFLRNWWQSGIAFGVVIWLVMVFVIMPLSRAPSVEINLKTALMDIANLVLNAGLPISFLAHRHRMKTSGVEKV
jgi:hypothetical protein